MHAYICAHDTHSYVYLCVYVYACHYVCISTNICFIFMCIIICMLIVSLLRMVSISAWLYPSEKVIELWASFPEKRIYFVLCDRKGQSPTSPMAFGGGFHIQ